MNFRVKKSYNILTPFNLLLLHGIFSAVVFLQFAPASAQTLEAVEIPSSPNPVGSGARALGMGGAFIAVADDATAASWNPGGLVQLERPELSVVGAGFLRTEDLTFGAVGANFADQSVSSAALNYLSFAYPFTLLQRNMIVSINYQQLFDFSRSWKLKWMDGQDQWSWDLEQTGSLYAYGLAYSVQIVPQLSFGFTLNLWEDGLYSSAWEQRNTMSLSTVDPGGNPFDAQVARTDRYSFSGFNANIGLLWNITDKLTLGAVFKTPFTADLDHTVKEEARADTYAQDVASSSADQQLDMPMSYGLGVAYRFSDKFTLSADLYRTEWQDFILTNADGVEISPVSGLPVDESDIDPTMQVRLGAEYLIIRPKYVIPLRMGFFYDPAPAEKSPDDFFGVTFGSGIGIGRFMFDFAYQYRFGRDVGGSILQGLDFSEDLDEHSFYTSLIIHF
ncbi:MAG: outer membrane protein transport protein [Desulforhabdus sp.]|jgi:long-subunit fatty acid transport protein|nr:outer membrane protein transport protein [Desulforhabdus sp.]